MIPLLVGLGGAFYYFKVLKSKQNTKGMTDIEDFDFEEYDEDEPEKEDNDKYRKPVAPEGDGFSNLFSQKSHYRHR